MLNGTLTSCCNLVLQIVVPMPHLSLWSWAQPGNVNTVSHLEIQDMISDNASGSILRLIFTSTVPWISP